MWRLRSFLTSLMGSFPFGGEVLCFEHQQRPLGAMLLVHQSLLKEAVMANCTQLYPSLHTTILRSISGIKAVFSPNTGMLTTDDGSFHLERDSFLEEWNGVAGDLNVTVNETDHELGICILEWW